MAEKKNFIWDKTEHISSLTAKNENEQIRISVNEKDGKKFIGIWRFYKKRGEDEFKPSGKGINLPADYLDSFESLIPEIKAKLK